MDISTSAFSSGLAGMQAGQQRVEQAATNLISNGLADARPDAAMNPSGASLSLSDMAANLVELTVGRNEVEASARVVETADEILGTLINIRA